MRSPYTTIYVYIMSLIGELLVSGINRDYIVIMPTYYSDLADVASNKDYKELADHSKYNLQIELEKSK
jgi:hypothetical protein